jgi:catechol 2,3-dioxygenase-like lactoylglutathione lyase family enzyme
MEYNNIIASKENGLPTMRGVEHIGLTAPNLDEATGFFVQVLGCEVVYTMGPFIQANPAQLKHSADWSNRAVGRLLWQSVISLG